MRKKGYIILVLVCLFYWGLDSVWSYMSYEYNLKKLIFSEPHSIVDTILLRVPPYQVVSRLMVVILFVLLGSIILEFIKKKQDAEQRRKQAYTTLSTILNSIDATIYVADMHTYEILFMNRKMIESFGGDFTGQKCHDVLRANPVPCEYCTNSQLVDEFGHPKDSVVWEDRNPVNKVWYINYDRAIRWIDGKVARLQVATDISYIKELQEKQLQAESRLRQAQKMESIGTLAGGIAHDFNNILSSVIGFTELALDDVEKGSPVEENLQEVYTAGKRAKDLVRQILAFARQSDEELSPVKVASVLKEVVKFVRSSIPTSIEIRSDINSEAYVLGNATQIHQVIMNLCINAVKAMESDGGILQVLLKDVQVRNAGSPFPSDLKKGDYIEIKVSDTGAGIPEDLIGFIFEPYFTTREVGEGTGMGLAVTHGIIERYGGKITVASTPGRGTLFTVYLPITQGKDQKRPNGIEVLPTGSEHILLIDDEESIVRAGGEVLERLGYSVTTSTSSLDALQLFYTKPNSFDLIVTDATMPNMTGDRLAAELMRIRPDIPIILCTGYNKKITDEIARQMGIRAFAFKPIVKSDFAKIVRTVLDEAQPPVQGNDRGSMPLS